jgi:hypothetical protein
MSKGRRLVKYAGTLGPVCVRRMLVRPESKGIRDFADCGCSIG